MMIQVAERLWVGNGEDFSALCKNGAGEFQVPAGWSVVQAAKEPYHRQALGYAERGAPKDHPEYLIAQRGNRLCLNLIDAPNPGFVPPAIFAAALQYINEALGGGNQVLVHCNQGMSRSPSIVLAYLRVHDPLYQAITDITSAERKFVQTYPHYNPAWGIREFVRQTYF